MDIHSTMGMRLLPNDRGYPAASYYSDQRARERNEVMKFILETLLLSTSQVLRKW